MKIYRYTLDIFLMLIFGMSMYISLHLNHWGLFHVSHGILWWAVPFQYVCLPVLCIYLFSRVLPPLYVYIAIFAFWVAILCFPFGSHQIHLWGYFLIMPILYRLIVLFDFKRLYIIPFLFHIAGLLGLLISYHGYAIGFWEASQTLLISLGIELLAIYPLYILSQFLAAFRAYLVAK